MQKKQSGTRNFQSNLFSIIDNLGFKNSTDIERLINPYAIKTFKAKGLLVINKILSREATKLLLIASGKVSQSEISSPYFFYSEEKLTSRNQIFLNFHEDIKFKIGLERVSDLIDEEAETHERLVKANRSST